MQCPSCGHQAPVADFGEPLRCPDCGIFYEKAVKLKALDAERRQAGSVEKPAAGSAGWDAKASIEAPDWKKTQNKRWTTVFAVFSIVVVALAVFKDGQKPSGGDQQQRAVPALSGLELAKRNVVLSSFPEIKHSVMTADFSIQNIGKVAIKDIEITCRHTAPSGTEIDRNTRVIYEIVAPGKTKTFLGFNMGFVHSQVASTRCFVTDLKI